MMDTGESVKPLIAILFVIVITLCMLAKTAYLNRGDADTMYPIIMMGSVAGVLVFYKVVNYIT